jgi:hypothetical protein
MADPTNSALPIGNTLLSVMPSSVFPDVVGMNMSSPSPFFTRLRLDWSKVDCLWEGTEAMRLARIRFLPQEPEEDDSSYARRLGRTTLHNFYKRTIQSGVAKVFSKDPHLEDSSAPPEIEDFLKDVDTQGRNIGQFGKDLLENATNHGIGYLLVDYANIPQDYSNLAEEQAAGNRPYWVKISAINVLDARSCKFADGERLGYFKFEEQVVEPSSDGGSSSIVQQIRIFKQDPAQPAVFDPQTGDLIREATGETPVYFAVYRRDSGPNGTPSGTNSASQWKLFKQGQISVNAIPVIPDYTNKVGFMVGKPPFLDLAEINIEHWQAKSDYNNILHFATVPILFGSGIRPEIDASGASKGVTVKANSAIMTNDRDAKLVYVEHSGAAIGAARQNIMDLEARMEKLGMVLTQQTGNVTATSTAITSAEANSLLKSYALNLQDTLNAALDFTAQYLNVEPTARIIINTDYAVDYTTDSTMADVLTAFNAGVIDKLTVIAEAKRRNVLDPAAAIVPPAQNESTAPGVLVNPAPGETDPSFNSSGANA